MQTRRTRSAAAITVAAVVCCLLTAAPAGSVADVRTTVTQDQDVRVQDLVGEHAGDALALPASGGASPYPAHATSAGSGNVIDVNLRLFGLTHDRPGQLDIMLVGPDGRQATVLSDVGGVDGVVDTDILLDDEAAQSLPQTGGFSPGAYRPTNHGSDDTFPAPAPSPTGAAALSVFDGTQAAGTWSLYVVDDTDGISGSIEGWALVVTRGTDPYPSNLVVGNVASTIKDLDVHLTLVGAQFGHLDLMLVGPGGGSVMLMSDVAGVSVQPLVDIVLDDEATSTLPVFSSIEPGRYRPTDWYGDDPDTFRPPAPLLVSGNLGAFDGTDPRGTWRLFGVSDDFGVSIIRSWSLDIEWQDYAAPSGSLTVDGGAPSTSVTSVTLALAADDPEPGVGVARMRFSDDAVTWSDFQPFAGVVPWTLPGGAGSKTVYAQVEDAAGNLSAPFSDTITLEAAAVDTTGPRGVLTRPKSGKKQVPRSTKIVVTTSEALRADSVDTTTVVLKRVGRAGRVAATVAYDAGRQRIVLDPRRRLATGARYRVTVTTSVRDLSGLAWDQLPAKPGAQRLSWTFRTR